MYTVMKWYLQHESMSCFPLALCFMKFFRHGVVILAKISTLPKQLRFAKKKRVEPSLQMLRGKTNYFAYVILLSRIEETLAEKKQETVKHT